MELSLIGLQNAGKTSLVNVLTTGTFHEDVSRPPPARRSATRQAAIHSGGGRAQGAAVRPAVPRAARERHPPTVTRSRPRLPPPTLRCR